MATSTNDVTPRINIEDSDYERFCDFFYRKTGIMFQQSKRYFVDKRLIERIEATESRSFLSYFSLLRYADDDNEMQLLINLMTVNETYFFREEYQFKCLVNDMLNEVVKYKKPGEPIRIWSVPSSSGEEAYSIVIYLLEYWKYLNDWDVEILSSDIDTDIIKRAEAGIYSHRSVQNLPEKILKKYFTPYKGDFQINEELREAVTFSRTNIVNEKDLRAFKKVDVIFCRNLLIYFDDVSRRLAADSFFDALNPGGFICLGHSESMSRISSLFKIRQFKDALVYQKSLEGK